jgi:hypothetical protein
MNKDLNLDRIYKISLWVKVKVKKPVWARSKGKVKRTKDLTFKPNRHPDLYPLIINLNALSC